MGITRDSDSVDRDLLIAESNKHENEVVLTQNYSNVSDVIDNGAQTGDDAIRGTKVRRALPTTIQDQDLVSHQDGFGNNRSEPAGSSKSDHDDDDMQKKSENVAHAEDGIRLKKLKNSGNLRNSPPTGNFGRFLADL